jgi:Tol biopolymer transport system component
MALASGTRLGPYEILSALGAGGMGEVYRARDSRLGRDVAVKVLPRHLSATPEVRARFEREAKTISQLNHPNICSLFDVGRAPDEAGSGEMDYLVMELVEGGTLAERLEKGPLPTAEVLKMGGQIADALDRAHRAGVVHRDLKPGNVMLTRAGAKLMDFGLARVTGLAGPAGESGVTVGALTRSPTMAQPLTAEGTLVGTFQYMAPEQLEGKEADARTDLWALGCVLYEMATGRRAFGGASQASLISSIMREEPAPISQLVPVAPAGLDRLVRACLAKDPDERIQTAHDVRLHLDWLREAGSSASVTAPVLPARRGVARPIVLAIGVLALVAAGVAVGRLLNAPRASSVVARLTVEAPAGHTPSSEPVQTAISPDGRTIAFVAADSNGTGRLWLRALDATEPRPLPGVENPVMLFWSPDSRKIGFFADGQLRKLAVSGGTSEVICAAADPRGVCWNRNGVILFAPEATGGLFQVSENGGEPVAVTRVDSASGETAHRFPSFLPDGQHFVFASLPARKGLFPIRVGSLGSPESKVVLEALTAPVYADPGFLVYTRGQSIVAQAFDPRGLKLRGEPFPLSEAPAQSNFDSSPRATSSNNGILALTEAGLPNTEVSWFDRGGRPLGKIPLPPGRWGLLSLTLDGQRLAIERATSQLSTDIWTIDVRQPNPSRFTFGPEVNVQPAWSPDGKHIAFTSNRGRGYEIYVKPFEGTGEERRLSRTEGTFANIAGWTQDSRQVTFFQPVRATGWDVWRVDAEGDRPPTPVVQSRFNEFGGVVSPDGKWILYYSDESGRGEAYVQSFPEGGRKVQVSNGGVSATTNYLKWTRGGREVLYFAFDGVTVMACDVETSPTFRAGVPRRLFRMPPTMYGMDVSGDGERFVLSSTVHESSSRAATVVMNWPALLRKPR